VTDFPRSLMLDAVSRAPAKETIVMVFERFESANNRK